MSATTITPPAQAAITGAAATLPVAGSGRLMSLDIFRGITIAAMLLVNNPGSWSAIYPPLGHAAWHGWTPTDLIFPFFLFIVGVAIVFAFAGRTAAGADRTALLKKSLWRGVKLFGLGLILQGFPLYHLSTIRIPGVLQRIALAFMVTAVLFLYTKLNTQVIVCAALLLGYWALQTLVPAPGVQPGVLEPGVDLGGYVDRAVFGEAHLWSQSRTWDPEGLLSTLPAVATCLTGVFAGLWLRSGRPPLEKTNGLFVAGWAALVIGLIWNPLFPINKSLWTSSYVLFTSGLACIFLALCYWLADIRGWRAWGKPFQVFGVNAIAAFFLSGLGARMLNLVKVGDGVALKTWLFDNIFLGIASPINASLLFALSYVTLWLGIMWLLYRRRIFIKV
jgi:predicted acyltransferase